MMMLLIMTLVTTVVGVYSSSVCDTCDCVIFKTMELIKCSSRGLQDTFPDLSQWPKEVQAQVGLQVSVSLEKNNIHRVGQFPLLPRIVRLSLAHNSIMDIATHAFLKLDSLTHLDLSHNLLTGDDLRADVLRGSFRSEVYEPMSLISLNLAFNKIHSLERKAFEHLPNLQELYLSGNLLSVIDIPTTTALGYPHALKVLDLSATGLSKLSPSFVHLKSLKNHLEVLILSANNFTEVPEELAALGSSLWELNLNGNPLRDLTEGSLLGLTSLRVLSISGMPYLRRIGPGAFDELDNLRVLYAAHNPRLNDIDVDAFREQKKKNTLKEVHLEHCALSSLPENLLTWHDLDILDIQSNPWNCDCELQWMTARLVPLIQGSDPEHTIELHCEAPLWLAGVSLSTLSQEHDGGRGVLCSPAPHEKPAKKAVLPKHRSLIATALLASAIVVCCVTAILASIACYRRVRALRPMVVGSVVYIPVREEAKY